MDSRFLPHNAHLEYPREYLKHDPQLRQLQSEPYLHRSRLLSRFPSRLPGIYTLGGGRQIGKTTLLKLWIHDLLQRGIAPEAIFFFSGELIDDHHALFRLIQEHLRQHPARDLNYILVDEVTYIREWDKAVKYLADAGILENTILMLTGSDLTLIQEARMRFPGRRGAADTVDFHLMPLSFAEYVNLQGRLTDLPSSPEWDREETSEVTRELFKAFERYLLHGGYLSAINEYTKTGRISSATLNTYSDWIRGDLLKRNKQESSLREILSAVHKRYGSQVTWNSLAQDLSIDHPGTVSSYIDQLVSMDVLFVQSALLEDKLMAAPKKAKKVMYHDPFIYHAVKAWLTSAMNPFDEQIQSALNDSELCSQLVEACAVTHFQRHYPTYYIKAQGEVDIAYIREGHFCPVEIKWTRQLRPKDIKQIGKYPSSLILTKQSAPGSLGGIPTLPLPWALFQLGSKADQKWIPGAGDI